MLFTPIRQQVLNVTEIGVAAGQSLQMWHDFFPRAQLWGLDLKSGACFERCPSKFAGHPRVHLRWGNSCKKPHVDRLGFAPESMDLVLDDGDHFPLSNEITLTHFWPFVKKGGYYVIEDVATGARPKTGRYGCRAAERGFPERCGFAPGGFAQLVHNRTALGAEARAIMEEADTVLVDTLPGHRNLDAFREKMGVTWMRDQVDHNSHLVVLRKRTEARRATVTQNYGKKAMPHFGRRRRLSEAGAEEQGASGAANGARGKCLADLAKTHNSISPQMRGLAAAAATGPAVPLRTAVLTAFLVRSTNPHRGGSFSKGVKKGPSKLHYMADTLIKRSQALCSPGVSLHVVHDLHANTTSRLGVTYHGFPAAPAVPADVRRWVLYALLLRRIPWDCAFAIDFSDVIVLNVPPCHALPPRLVIGADGQGAGVLGWLRKVAAASLERRPLATILLPGDPVLSLASLAISPPPLLLQVTRSTELLASVSASYRAFLQPPPKGCPVNRTIVNCGVVGGSRAALLPMLDRVVSKISSHWATERSYAAGGDMVLWNELNIDLDGGPHAPLTGWPHGPTNLPMYSGSVKGSCMARYVRNATGRFVNPCRRWFLTEARGMYWFAHKPAAEWTVDRFAVDPGIYKKILGRFKDGPDKGAPYCIRQGRPVTE